MTPDDVDALLAAAELIGRSGASEYEGGYLHDDVPVDQAGWWARCRVPAGRAAVQAETGRLGSLKGTYTLLVENQPGPVQAIEALAAKLITGGQCTYCRRRIIIADFHRKRCRWHRVGQHWVPGCKPPDWVPPTTEAGAALLDRMGQQVRRITERRNDA